MPSVILCETTIRGAERLKPLEGGKYLNLETYRKTGVAIATPVWFAAEGDTISMA